MVGAATPSTWNLGSTGPVGAKSPILNRYSLNQSINKFISRHSTEALRLSRNTYQKNSINTNRKSEGSMWRENDMKESWKTEAGWYRTVVGRSTYKRVQNGNGRTKLLGASYYQETGHQLTPTRKDDGGSMNV